MRRQKKSAQEQPPSKKRQSLTRALTRTSHSLEKYSKLLLAIQWNCNTRYHQVHSSNKVSATNRDDYTLFTNAIPSASMSYALVYRRGKLCTL